MQRYHDLVFGDPSLARQQERGSRAVYAAMADEPPPERLGAAEVEFLTERDSFYLASVGRDGWPYVQHRGGPAGFVHVVGPTRIRWADRVGNRQYVSAGNLDLDDRVAIIAMDYPRRRRLKLAGHATFDSDPDDEVVASLGETGRLEGVVTVDVVAFEWNCPKFITPRFTEAEVVAATEPLRHRIAELEARLAGATATNGP
jgi:predicted pyridoxine 5'-phosphate oxidase superfamily flavin-nucleotide-binding protein